MWHEVQRVHASLRRRFGGRSPRRFHAYCIGAAKTGTTSAAACFEVNYRTQHEPEARKTNRLVIDYLEGKISESEVRDLLLARDRRFHLEMESSHPLCYLSGILVDLFPDAKFIATVREPLDWLRSRLNFHYKVDPPAWREYRTYFWISRQNGYPEEERILKEYGLCSLDVYLSQYADHYKRIEESVEDDRLLVVKTEDISTSVNDIGSFLQIDEDTLTTDYRNKSEYVISALDRLNPDYVINRIASHCEDLIRSYYPERISFYGLHDARMI